jgi:protein-ribulosamine 3-kinase
MTDALKAGIAEALSAYAGHNITISAYANVSGGCINDCYALTTSAGKFFVKTNNAARYPGMMAAEEKGLQLLASTKAISTPRVITTGECAGHSFILMEYLEQGSASPDFWEDFGYSLARLHRNTTDAFGLEYDNYIGSLPQYNAFTSLWIDFFRYQRIEVQLKIAIDNQLIDNSKIANFEALYKQLPSIVPTEQPSLLHGDLWSGNFLYAANAKVALIDPSVYYGHREMEIAFTSLFGGFHPRLYDAYNNAWPLQPGFDERKDIYNLYSLLVHLNLFGRSYLSQIEGILQRFTRSA